MFKELCKSCVRPCCQFVESNLKAWKQPGLLEFPMDSFGGKLNYTRPQSASFTWWQETTCSCLLHYLVISFRSSSYIHIFYEYSKVLGFITTHQMTFNFSRLFQNSLLCPSPCSFLSLDLPISNSPSITTDSIPPLQ